MDWKCSAIDLLEHINSGATTFIHYACQWTLSTLSYKLAEEVVDMPTAKQTTALLVGKPQGQGCTGVTVVLTSRRIPKDKDFRCTLP